MVLKWSITGLSDSRGDVERVQCGSTIQSRASGNRSVDHNQGLSGSSAQFHANFEIRNLGDTQEARRVTQGTELRWVRQGAFRSLLLTPISRKRSALGDQNSDVARYVRASVGG